MNYMDYSVLKDSLGNTRNGKLFLVMQPSEGQHNDSRLFVLECSFDVVRNLDFLYYYSAAYTLSISAGFPSMLSPLHVN